MTPRDFAYWLQGVFELSEAAHFNERQTKMIGDHLNLVFEHVIESDPKPTKAPQKPVQSWQEPAYFSSDSTARC